MRDTDSIALHGRSFEQAGPPAVLLASAIAVAIAGLLVLVATAPGPLSHAMLLHIATMNIAAPLAAVAVSNQLHSTAGPRTLAAAAMGQLIVLWIFHTPWIVASGSLLLHLVLQALLFGSALLFWLTVQSMTRDLRWSPLGALLLTGKLACLIGALLVFAPRPLYASIGWCAGSPASLDDQHLAGLLMLTACPLSYLIAGVIAASHLVLGAERAAAGRHGHLSQR
jgi:putative membrane protein